MINSIEIWEAPSADTKPMGITSTCRVKLDSQKLSRSATLHPEPFEIIPVSNQYWKSNNFRLESQ